MAVFGQDNLTLYGGHLRDLLRKSRLVQRVRADLPAPLLWILECEGHKHLPHPFALPRLDCFCRC